MNTMPFRFDNPATEYILLLFGTEQLLILFLNQAGGYSAPLDFVGISLH